MLREVRAWVADGPGLDLAPEPLLLDEIRPGEVLVKTAAVGVCHTDIAYTDGSLPRLRFRWSPGTRGRASWPRSVPGSVTSRLATG